MKVTKEKTKWKETKETPGVKVTKKNQREGNKRNTRSKGNQRKPGVKETKEKTKREGN